MKRDTVNYFVVGAFVLILFLAFLIVIYRITGTTGPTDQYYVSYHDVEGIKHGTAVLYEGYNIGQVALLEPVRGPGGMQFRIMLSVVSGWKIPRDSVAEIVKSGFLSEAAIDIREGESRVFLSPNDFIRGREAADIFSTVNDTAADIQALTRDSLRPLLENINKLVDLIATDFIGVASEGMKPLEKQLTSLLEKLNESADRLLNLLNEDNQQNVEQMLTNLDVASNELGGLLKRMEASRASLDTLLTKLDNVVDNNDDDIRTLVKDLQKSLYVVSQHINAVAHHMEGSSRNMQEFTRQIKENPGLLLRGSPQPDLGETE
ncbi:MAG: MlaD family protein [Gammaproteobacteria bacterium]